MKLDKKAPYGQVYGHGQAVFEQDGVLFDGAGESLPTANELKKRKPAPNPVEMNQAEAFLLQILKGNPLTKSAVYKETESNNQNWDEVRDAAVRIGIIKFQQAKMEMWKLPEEAFQ